MDIVTHAVSGLLVARALPARPATRWTPVFFMLAACLPDFDLLFASTPALFLNLHRGISHSVFLAPVLAMLLAVCAWPLRRRQTPGRMRLPALWLAFAGCLYLHILLDCFTTYGTMIFLPFSSMRVRLNATFIVDIFMTLPALLLLIAGVPARQKARLLAGLGLAWLVIYPCFNMGMSALAGRNLADSLRTGGRDVVEMSVLPDFFSPLFWRAIVLERTEDGSCVEHEQSISALGSVRGGALSFTPVPQSLQAHLAAQSTNCRDFFRLMLMPVYRPFSEQGRNAAVVALSFLPPGDDETPTAGTGHDLHPITPDRADEFNFLLIHDLRFGSGLAFGRQLLGMRPNAGLPFMLLVVTDAEDNLLLERIIFRDARMDTGWQPPQAPEPQSFGDWLLGLS